AHQLVLRRAFKLSLKLLFGEQVAEGHPFGIGRLPHRIDEQSLPVDIFVADALPHFDRLGGRWRTRYTALGERRGAVAGGDGVALPDRPPPPPAAAPPL